MMTEDHQLLQQFLSTQFPLPDSTLQPMIEAWEPFTAKRKTMITAMGERERYIYFVVEGIQRVCYLTADGSKEATVIFTYAPSFSGLADAFLHQQPSDFYVECLTPSRFLRISHADFTRLRLAHPPLHEMIIWLAGVTMRGLLTRMAELQTLSAEEKFRSLLTRSPHLLNLIPHKYLASYLGIDPTTFSRLLGKVRL